MMSTMCQGMPHMVHASTCIINGCCQPCRQVVHTECAQLEWRLAEVGKLLLQACIVSHLGQGLASCMTVTVVRVMA
jgi:hypothetical protein